MSTPDHRVRAGLVVLVSLAIGLAACRAKPPPSFVLISLDTTRADHVGPYGYDGGTTPNMDRFAERATVYLSAYSTSSWTIPAHASLFTGLLPMQHGAGRAPEGSEQADLRRLGDEFDTLAERLRAAGYRTAAVVSGPPLKRDLGFAQGFEDYDDNFKTFQGRRAQQTADRALERIKQFGDSPYFLFVHFWDPHDPYRPPPPFNSGLVNSDLAVERNRRNLVRTAWQHIADGTPVIPTDQLAPDDRATIAEMLQAYDAEIRYTDANVGRILKAIDDSPREGDTFVIITADHGESFGEHWYFGHTSHLYEQFVRVPLMVRTPGQERGERLTNPVQIHQIFATILEAAGLKVGPEAGVALPKSPQQVVIQVDTARGADIPGMESLLGYSLQALYASPYKLIKSSTDKELLFDLTRDPGELRNLSDGELERRQALDAQLAAFVAQHPALYKEAPPEPLHPDTTKALRALGYIQ